MADAVFDRHFRPWYRCESRGNGLPDVLMLSGLRELVDIERQNVVALCHSAVPLYRRDLDKLSLVVHIEHIVIFLRDIRAP